MSLKEKLPPHLREFRGWRNAILGTLLVLCGLASALVAMIARRLMAGILGSYHH